MQPELQHSYQSDDSTEIDLQSEFLKYLRYWPWFLASVLLFVTSSFLYLRYTPKIYSSIAKIKMLDEGDGLELSTATLVVNKSKINLENEIVLLKSFRILENVVKELTLTTIFTEIGSIKSNVLDQFPFQYHQKAAADSLDISLSYDLEINKEGLIVKRSDGQVFVAPDFNTSNINHSLPFEIILDNNLDLMIGKRFGISFTSERSATNRLREAIEITSIPDSHILELKILGQNKRLSQKILNKLIAVFNDDDINDRQTIWRRTIKFVNERFVDLSKELDSIEDIKKEFKKKNNLIDIRSDAGLSLQNRVQSDSEIYETENQLAITKFIKQELLTSTKSIEF